MITIAIVITIKILIIAIIICVYSSEPEHNLQVAPLKHWVYKILKSERQISQKTATWFTTHWSSGNWSDIEKELETGVRLIEIKNLFWTWIEL